MIDMKRSFAELAAIFPPQEETNMTDVTESKPPEQPPEVDALLCSIHMTPMIRVLQHIGHGNTELSDPYCPYCQELAAVAQPEQQPNA